MLLPGSVKRALMFPLTSTPGWTLLRGWRGRRLLSVCYHAVLDDSNPQRDGNAVSQTTFRRQLEFLGRHFQFVSLARFEQSLQSPVSPRPPLLITFDDGYRNNLTVAAPILQQLGIPAVFFLTTNYINTNRLLWPLELDLRLASSPGAVIPLPDHTSATIPANPSPLAHQLRRQLKGIADTSRLAYLEQFRAATSLNPALINRQRHDFLSWGECRQLQQLGFDIGSHTCEHPILSRLEPPALDYELTASRNRIAAELGQPPSSIAYPNGGLLDYSPAVIDASRRAGYNLAFAVGDRFHAPAPSNQFAIQRIIVQGGISPVEFSFIMSGWRDYIKTA